MKHILVHICMSDSDVNDIGEWHTPLSALSIAIDSAYCCLPHPDLYAVFHNEDGEELFPHYNDHDVICGFVKQEHLYL